VNLNTENKNMKKTMLVIGLAYAALTSAHANLGETYDQACKRYGWNGVPTKVEHEIAWEFSDFCVYELFANKISVMALLEAKNGRIVSPEVASKFAKTQAPSLSWRELSPPTDNNIAEFISSDDQIHVTVRKDGIIQVAYQSWMERNGLTPETAK
jgi:hypothetical protein